MENTNTLPTPSFLADAIDKIIALSCSAMQPEVLEVNGHTLLVRPGEPPREYGKRLPAAPEPLKLRSLDALVTLIRTEAVKAKYTGGSPLYVSCESYQLVRVFLQPDETREMERQTLYLAYAEDVPGFRDCKWSVEEAQIRLRACFQQGRFIGGETTIHENDVDYILGLLAHMSTDQSVRSDDNGITQTVQVRKGVSFVESQQVKPIVTLAPYRTFQEVAQPACAFVFRVFDDRGVSLTEADGGMWRLDARQTIKEYLIDHLASEIDAGSVYVTL